MIRPGDRRGVKPGVRPGDRRGVKPDVRLLSAGALNRQSARVTEGALNRRVRCQCVNWPPGQTDEALNREIAWVLLGVSPLNGEMLQEDARPLENPQHHVKFAHVYGHEGHSVETAGQ